MNVLSFLNKNRINIIRLLFCMILGFCISFFPQCKIAKSSGQSVKFRPPPQVFGIVWPILYTLFGISWILARLKTNDYRYDILFVVLSVSLSSWIVIYSCLSNKLGGIYSILITLLLLLITIILVPKISKILLIPLLTWIMFALLLNIFEVQLIK